MGRYSEEELLAGQSPELRALIEQYKEQLRQRDETIQNLNNVARINKLNDEYNARDKAERERLAKEKQKQLDNAAKIHQENLKKESGLTMQMFSKYLLSSLVRHGKLIKSKIVKAPPTAISNFKNLIGYTESTTSVDGIERQIRFLKLIYKTYGEQTLDFIKTYLDFLYTSKPSITKNKNDIIYIKLYVKERSGFVSTRTISSATPEAFRMYVMSCVIDSFVIPEKTEGDYEYVTHIKYENFKVLAYQISKKTIEANKGAFFPFWIKKPTEPVEFTVSNRKYTVKPEDFNSLKLDDFQLYFEKKSNTFNRSIKEEARWPCLWFSLMQAGVSVDELTKIKKFLVYKTGEVERAKLGQIAEQLNLRIDLHHLRGSESDKINIHIFGDRNSKKVVDIGLFGGHYFIWKNIEVRGVSKSGTASTLTLHPIRFLINCSNNDLLKPYTEKEKESMDMAFGEIFEEDGEETLFSKIDIFRPNFNIVEKLVSTEDGVVNIYKTVYDALRKPRPSQHDVDPVICKTWGVDLCELMKKERKQRYGACSDLHDYAKPRWFDKFRFVGCFDLETFVNKDGDHEFLCGSWCCIDSVSVCADSIDKLFKELAVKSFRSINEFLNDLPNNTLLYAHNLKFDYNFLFVDPSWKAINQVKKDGQLYEITFGKYEATEEEDGPVARQGDGPVVRLTKKITLRDSLKIITMPLRDFHKSFNLSRFIEIGKEYCNYEFYAVAEHRDWNFTCDSSLYSDQLPHQENFSPMRYLDYYCQQDVRVLMLGLLAFREDILKLPINVGELPLRVLSLPVEHRQPTLEIFDYLSAASFAQEYFVVHGAYEGVQPICGSNLNFVMKAMVGGKTVCSTKTSQRETRQPVVALDAVSLYPTAMSQIPGYPIGPGKVWRSEVRDGEAIDSSVYGIFEVEILAMENKEYSLPAFRYRAEKRGRGRPRKQENMTCSHIDSCEAENSEDRDVLGECGLNVVGTAIWDHGDARYKGRKIVADTITLRDYEMLYGLKYKILQGIYWTEFNTRVNDIIKDLFQKRLEYKKAGNKGLSNVVKLIMNSAYGKNLIKPSEKEERVYVGERELLKVYGPRFLESHEISGSKFVKILSCSYNQSNFAHLGVMILSQSKHYMNRLLELSSPDSIFYQDTDSYHILRSEVQPLADRYREKYGAELLGSSLCQFHVDYEYEKPLETLYSEHSVYVCPKVYAERIRCDDDEAFDEIFFRCKGVPAYSIEKFGEKVIMKGKPGSASWSPSDRERGLRSAIMDIYTSRKEVEFDLLEGRANIKIGKAGFVGTREEFKRKIKMNAEKNCIEERKERENVRGFLTS